MISFIKNKLLAFALGAVLIVGLSLPLFNTVDAKAPEYERNFTSHLTKDGWVLNPAKMGQGVDENKQLRQNIIELFYPNVTKDGNHIYKVIRGVTLGVMIIFIVMAGASLLLNKKPEDSKKHLWSLLYILLGGVFIYAANWLFGDVFNFNAGDFTAGQTGIGGFTKVMIGEGSVAFVILSAIKAFAFFLAIIMIVVTGFKVVAAGEGEKGKKLAKGLINVVAALLVIKGVDFIYYLAADSSTFVKNASDFIINVARVFGYIYGVIIVIMVIISGYLYITDGGTGSNFKKASNVLINILLSALVLFAFLLITYQIFAEFQEGGDALEVAAESTGTSG